MSKFKCHPVEEFQEKKILIELATQICPNCKADTFTWSIDNEENALTKWACHECGYTAWEDETLERDCLICGKKTEMHMKDNVMEYWWCSSCNKITSEDQIK